MRAEPTGTVRFLSVDEARAVHDAVRGQFGGAPGVRDPGLLESALYRPRTGHYADVAEMAAALLESLLVSLPSLAANKRAAFFTTDVFLRLNGWSLRAEAVTTGAFLRQAVDAGSADYDRLLPLIRAAIRRSRRTIPTETGSLPPGG